MNRPIDLVVDYSKILPQLAKVKNELKLLLPEKFQEKFEKYAYISGGCIYSLWNNKEPKDYDFFIKDKNFVAELCKYFTTLENIKRFKDFYQCEYKNCHLLVSRYAISLGKYQIITKYIGEPKEVVSQFDFKHNQFYYDDGKINTMSDWEFLDTNKLCFNEDRARDITGTILRIPKFVERGMTLPKSEVAKMLAKLCTNGFDENEKEILKYNSTY